MVVKARINNSAKSRRKKTAILANCGFLEYGGEIEI